MRAFMVNLPVIAYVKYEQTKQNGIERKKNLLSEEIVFEKNK